MPGRFDVPGQDGVGGREYHRDEHGHRGGEHEHEQRPAGDPALVKLVHPPGVDQLACHPQMRDERARHPRAPLVQELLKSMVRADHHDQAGPLGVGHEQRDVLTGAGEVTASRPSSRTRASPGARPSGYACTTSSAPQHRDSSDTESMSPKMASGWYPASISASAPPSTATITGLYSRI